MGSTWPQPGSWEWGLAQGLSFRALCLLQQEQEDPSQCFSCPFLSPSPIHVFHLQSSAPSSESRPQLSWVPLACIPSTDIHQSLDTCQIKDGKDLPAQESWWGQVYMVFINQMLRKTLSVLDILKGWLSVLKWFKCRIIEVYSNLFVHAFLKRD